MDAHNGEVIDNVIGTNIYAGFDIYCIMDRIINDNERDLDGTLLLVPDMEL